MVLGLKPMGKPSTEKKKSQVLDRTEALHGPRTQAYGETKYREEKITSFGQNRGLAWSSDSSLWGNQVQRRKNHKFWTEPRPCMVLELKPMGKPSTEKKKSQVLDRTKALHGPRTQAYGETKYREEKITSFGQNQGLAWSSDSSLWGNQVQRRKNHKFWTEPRPCMVLGFKPMGKPSTKKKKSQVLDRTKALHGPRIQAYGETKYKKEKITSFGQNQGLAWSSDSSLWGNQVQKINLTSFGQNQGLAWSSDSSLWGNQVQKRKYHKFWTEPRPCMVLGLKPMGKPSTKKKISQVLDRTKSLHGPRTQAYGESKYKKENITSFGQNQVLAWSSDSSLWGNQVQKRKYHKFWTEPSPCMVLGLKPMGKPSTKKKISQVLDRTKSLHGPRTQAYGESKYKKENITSFGQNQVLAWSS